MLTKVIEVRLARGVLTQAVGLRKYLWTAGITVITVLFNPIVPVALSRRTWF
jgi:hypothetical protein